MWSQWHGMAVVWLSWCAGSADKDYDFQFCDQCSIRLMFTAVEWNVFWCFIPSVSSLSCPHCEMWDAFLHSTVVKSDFLCYRSPPAGWEMFPTRVAACTVLYKILRLVRKNPRRSAVSVTLFKWLYALHHMIGWLDNCKNVLWLYWSFDPHDLAQPDALPVATLLFLSTLGTGTES